MKLKQRSGCWHIDWTDPDGQRHRKSLKLPAAASRRKALAKATEYQSAVLLRLREGERPASIPCDVSGLAAEYLRWVEVHRAESTAVTYRSVLRTHVAPFFRGTDARRIDAGAVERLKANISAKGLSPITVNVCLMALMGVFDHGLRLGYLKTNVVRGVEILPVPESEASWYTAEERDVFLAAARRHEPQWWTWFAFAFHTGVRIGEQRELRWLDVELAEERVAIQRKVLNRKVGLPKGRKTRMLPLNEVAQRALEEIRGDATPLPDCLVWPNRNGNWRGAGVARTALGRIAKAAGLPVIKHHGTRHTFCSAGARIGIHPHVLQRLAGHASITTTMKYFHAVEADLCEAVHLIGGGRRTKLRVVGRD